MARTLILVFSLSLLSFFGHADDGKLHIKSENSVEQTISKLENILNNKGMTIFAKIDHSAGAKSVGQELRPTQLVIFGNPKVGSPLMACEQTIALDLPQKALIWEDENKQTWISYNDPAYLKSRHNVEGCDPVFEKVTKALKGMLGAAAQR